MWLKQVILRSRFPDFHECPVIMPNPHVHAVMAGSQLPRTMALAAPNPIQHALMAPSQLPQHALMAPSQLPRTRAL